MGVLKLKKNNSGSKGLILTISIKCQLIIQQGQTAICSKPEFYG